MKMTFRWYGRKDDKISLQQIRQIFGMDGIITSLYDVPVGEAWQKEQIAAVKSDIEANGLTLEGIESVNVHEDIKLGLPTRDKYIENYIESLKNLSECGVRMVCYNFMPVFDWTRSDLFMPLSDGSTCLCYKQKDVDRMDAKSILDDIGKGSGAYTLPGWEPERLKNLKTLFAAYEGMTHERMWENLAYFLHAIIPYCEKYDVKMAIHPDDPPWDIFGLPRLITGEAALDRFLAIENSPYNGLTLCTGSLGSSPDNDIPALVRKYSGMGRIHFMHVRNVAIESRGNFHEAPHKTSEGSLDMYAIMKALYDTGYEGPIRPDHGRMIWGETGRPGYGLYDRALAATYLVGLWEAIERGAKG